jgi:FecR protein
MSGTESTNRYLWDRTGPPDPEIARLEQILGTLARRDPPPALALPPPVSTSARWVGIALLAASLAIAVTGMTLTYWLRPPAAAWTVTRLAGAPTIGSHEVGDRGRLPVGGWLETDARAKAAVAVADIGRVEIQPRTRLRLVSTERGSHVLELERGSLYATISAPPGQFFVQTPSSTAIDLGCAYTLTVDDEGSGLIRVLVGWVGFASRGRESFVPAGSACVTRRGVGPGTPYNERVSPAFREALQTIDFRPLAPDARAALDLLLAEAEERDEVTLWHLLSRAPAGDRDRVFDRLAAFVPPPVGVTRDGIREGRRDMLDQWWDAMALGPKPMLK